MTIRVLFLLLLLIAPGWTSATSTMCVFHGTNGSTQHSVEFTGYEEVQMVQVNSHPGRRSLPNGSYEVLEFDELARKVHMSYRNPGDAEYPPSFTLEGVGDAVRMTVHGKQVVGNFNCEF